MLLVCKLCLANSFLLYKIKTKYDPKKKKQLQQSLDKQQHYTCQTKSTCNQGVLFSTFYMFDDLLKRFLVFLHLVKM